MGSAPLPVRRASSTNASDRALTLVGGPSAEREAYFGF
jgi:hypothetical protein